MNGYNVKCNEVAILLVTKVATTCFSCSPPDVNLVANQCHILYTCQITTATG